MSTTQDYLTNILLVTLILFLVYILYRRLLVMLGKDQVQHQYVHFGNARIEQEGGSWKVELEVPADCEVKVVILDADGNERATVHDGSLTAGDHSLNVVTRLEPGTYTCRFTSPHQRAERYFTVS